MILPNNIKFIFDVLYLSGFLPRITLHKNIITAATNNM